jgi:hypothetical protein
MALGANRDYKTAARKVQQDLARHAELMKKFIAQGMTREEASAQALREMRGKN